MLALLLASAPMTPPPLPPEQVHEIIIHNRILTRVNGRTISMLDVVKNMDVFLSRHYPHLFNSTTARFQFYTTQWRTTLQQMVDTELMVADAESKSIAVTDGDVREEIQSRFGPNVTATLDKLGLTREEAKRLVWQEMLVQRIQGFRVSAKVLQKVSSQTIKEAYRHFLKENPPKNSWNYQFATLRSSSSLAEIAHQFISLKDLSQNSLNTAADLFKEKLPQDVTLTISQEFETENKAISAAHRSILSQLEQDQWSTPMTQTSQDGTTVVRIFHLKHHTQEKAPAFSSLVNQLRMQMLNQTADEEMTTYRAKLYKRFNFDEKSLDIPPQFEPFTPR
jgi:hypothetical protein